MMIHGSDVLLSLRIREGCSGMKDAEVIGELNVTFAEVE